MGYVKKQNKSGVTRKICDPRASTLGRSLFTLRILQVEYKRELSSHSHFNDTQHIFMSQAQHLQRIEKLQFYSIDTNKVLR